MARTNVAKKPDTGMHSEKKKGPPARLPHENMLVIHPRVLRQRPLFDTTYNASTLSVVQIY